MDLGAVYSIIDKILELPWYKVLIIAIVDDIILFIKIWPIYIIIFVLAVLYMIMIYE